MDLFILLFLLLCRSTGRFIIGIGVTLKIQVDTSFNSHIEHKCMSTTDEWPDAAFFLRFFFDFLLFLAFGPDVDSLTAGATDADGVPPSLSFVSPSSLSGATTTTAGGVGADFFLSSPSVS
jgi:hypothetical protein